MISSDFITKNTKYNSDYYSNNKELMKSFININLSDKSSLLLIKEWLNGFLPITFGLYTYICDLIHRNDTNESFYLYINDIKNPLVIILIICTDELSNEVMLYSSITMDSNYEDSIQILMNNHINRSKDDVSITVSKLDWKSLKSVKKIMNKCLFYQSDSNLYSLYVYYGLQINSNDLPLGYSYSSIEYDDIQGMLDQYQNESLSFNEVLSNLKKNRSYGIRYLNKQLVSWILFNEHGAINSIFTIADHRSKGLAKAIIRKYLSNNSSDFNGVYISNKNDSVISYFKKRGYIRQTSQYWLKYTKYANDNSLNLQFSKCTLKKSATISYARRALSHIQSNSFTYHHRFHHSNTDNFINYLPNDKSIIYFDTETTGLSSYDRIIEIALVKRNYLEMTETRFYSLINPQGRRSSPKAYECHKIKDDQLLNERQFHEIVDNLLEFIGDNILIGHNVSFDKRMLNNELKRLNYNHLPDEQFKCSLSLARSIYSKDNKLDSLCVRYDIDLSSRSKSHGAMQDNLLLADLYPLLVVDSLNK